MIKPSIKTNNGIRLGGGAFSMNKGASVLLNGPWMVCLTDIYRDDAHIRAVLSRCDMDGNIFEGGDVIEIGDRYVTASVSAVEGKSWSRADAGVLIQVPKERTDPKTGEEIKYSVRVPQWKFSHSLKTGDYVLIEEDVVVGYILDKNGEKCTNDFSVNCEQQRRFSLTNNGAFGSLTNDKGEEVTKENYEEWANSFIEKVYQPFLDRISQQQSPKG